jgi:hypothetical protein
MPPQWQYLSHVERESVANISNYNRKSSNSESGDRCSQSGNRTQDRGEGPYVIHLDTPVSFVVSSSTSASSDGHIAG